MKRCSILLALLLFTFLYVTAQPSEFKVPITIQCSSLQNTIYIGVHGDGPGGAILDNTYGGDLDTLYGPNGLWAEELSPPPPPTMYWWINFDDIRALGGTGLYPYDFRGYTDINQIDTFAFRVRGDSLGYWGEHTISWPAGLTAYADTWTLKRKQGPNWVTDVLDMTSWTSYTNLNLGYMSDITYMLIKGGAKTVGVEGEQETQPSVPGKFGLSQNYPNPFNPTTQIAYQVAKTGLVSIKIYNMLGQEVTTLVNEMKKAGSHEAKWDAVGLGSGIYFYKMQAGSFTETRKMILIK